jgi:DNA-3-methyladenine glycosylase II
MRDAARGAPVSSYMRKAVHHLRTACPVMAGIIGKVGPCKLSYRQADFHSLARSIVFQQLNGKAAGTIFDRLTAVAKSDPLTPAALLKLSPEKLRAAGLSAQKASYIRDLAERTKAGSVNFATLPDLDDSSVIEHLTQVKGVGVWTAQMTLIFALKRHDVLPTADYGIRAAMKKAYDLPELPKPAQMEEIAERWRPYRSIACWYLWRYLDGPAEG